MILNLFQVGLLILKVLLLPSHHCLSEGETLAREGLNYKEAKSDKNWHLHISVERTNFPLGSIAPAAPQHDTGMLSNLWNPYKLLKIKYTAYLLNLWQSKFYSYVKSIVHTIHIKFRVRKLFLNIKYFKLIYEYNIFHYFIINLYKSFT